ncbi:MULTISPECIES: benenodin family lasso peptide [unclassified Novosphingobium]|nr:MULTISPECIES: benenodin family lasso peptide [unclassified Novosphingobium]NLR41351.1 benenodin family lasso peptide [Novosphingobium sp. ERW19]QOV96156.1 benenodin family lasso peptide [Novosphingobium sp. ES2-1]
MTENTPREDTLIDLGEASTTTKGQAIVELDVSGGNLRFLPGIAAE